MMAMTMMMLICEVGVGLMDGGGVLWMPLTENCAVTAGCAVRVGCVVTVGCAVRVG